MTNNSTPKPIGVFDSGFGGLSVLRCIVKELPKYDYIYLGDTARTPYGARSQEVLYGFTKQAVDFLFRHNCELIILACNTASSEALRKIQQEYLPKYYPDKRVLGVIIPTAERAIEITQNNKIGVMATESTVASAAFERELKKLKPFIQVFQQGCPLLVPIVESGEQNSEVTDIMLRKYLSPLLKKKIDTLILGCTHYGILESKIKKIVSSNITVVSEGKIVAKKLKQYLQRHPEINQELTKNHKTVFYTTDTTSRFEKLGSKFFGRKIEPVKAHLDYKIVEKPILVQNKIIMAASITHIVLTHKVLGTILKGYRKKDFIVGTMFPDIRYLSVIERDKTHPKNPPHYSSLPKGSFLSGLYFHSLVDNAREDFMVSRRVYSLCVGSAYATTALKLLEDEILYNKIKDWRKIIRYFDSMLSQEIAFGIKKEEIRKWHIILQTYMGHTPNKESRINFLLALRFPWEKIETIEIGVQKMKENKEVLQIIEDFYDNFEMLLK